ncbi:MAG: AraC family transcriptional regulator, partial [Anaerolineae bacterium]|nr:AraC family transcriptional regulator [Anaerolineae bacterium]
EAMLEEIPSLVILDLMMPEMNGFDVLDWMRANDRTRQAPVLILSSRVLNLEDVKRIERHALVTVQSKEILSEDETVAALHRLLFDSDQLPPHTGALVKQTIAYFHQHYTRPFSRDDIKIVARQVGFTDPAYFSRVFHKIMGCSPTAYRENPG